MSSYSHWHVFLYFLAKTFIKILIYLSHLKTKKTELNNLSELECSKTPSKMSSYAHQHVFLYLHAQTDIGFFKSLKIHNSNNICGKAFCLASNETVLSNLFTLSTSFEGSFARFEIPNFCIRKWKPSFSRICQKVLQMER